MNENTKTAISVVKSVGCFVIATGVGIVMKNLIRATTPTNTKIFINILISVGAFAVATHVSGIAADNFGDSVDRVVKLVNDFVTDTDDLVTE